jgi:penicillin-binding protein 1B
MRKSLFKLGVFFLVIFAFYLLYLDYQINSKFKYHRWNLPSRVYSDSFPLYPGLQVTESEIDEKLAHLGYRAIAREPSAHGAFQKDGARYTIYLHRFEYPQESMEGYPLTFQIKGNRITSLHRSDTDEPVSLVRLEPELIASIFDEDMEDRTFVPLDEIPEDLSQAVITTEDERFYSHWGIDPRGIARAFLANLKAGSIKQGGSTLTQQLVKNFFLHSGRSYLRKINEALMALLLEVRYGKDEILEAYLNEIYLGQHGSASIAGVAEAASYYFSKEVSQLSLAECALLAGMIRSPGYYSPYKQKERSIKRRNFVLKKMHDRRIILDEEYEAGIKEGLPKHHGRKTSTNAPYFIDFVKKQLKENFPSDVLQSEGLRLFTTLDMNLQRAAEKSMTDWLDKLEKDYSSLKKRAEAGQYLQGTVVAMQPQTGHIRAYVGGRDYQKVQFDHASEAHRQPGSAFKPFVYLSALDPARRSPPYTLSTLIDDEPMTVKSGGKKWTPQNYDRENHGRVRLRTALEKSYNVSTVRLALEIGLDHVIYTARQAGMSSPLEPFPSLALGSFEVTPLELLSAYTIFPNQGIRTEPVSIQQVVKPSGEVLEKRDLAMKQVFSEDVIYLMNRLLAGVFDEGTAASARASGFSVVAGGKTGTTSDYRDAWFVGYTPELLALTWVGYDDNSNTGLSGSSGALPVWTRFMKKATAGKRYRDFTASKNILVATIDEETGLLTASSCGESRKEYFIAGTEPKEFCDEVELIDDEAN